MNLFRVNSSKRELISYNKQEDCVKIEAGNSFEHEFLKFCVCFILKNKKHPFVTEARFKLGGRADIVDLQNRVIYEILHSENESNFEFKMEKYPNWEKVKIFTKHYKNKSYENIIQDISEIIL